MRPFAIQREKVLVCISASTMQWQYLPTLSRFDAEREFVSVLCVLGLGTLGIRAVWGLALVV